MKCQRCGYDNVASSNYCRQCGANLEDQKGNRTEIIPPSTVPNEYDTQNICPVCGCPNSIGARFCENCGTGLLGQGPGIPDPNNWGSDSRNLLVTILLGVGIGLALLILILGFMHFLQSDDDSEQSETTTTTQEETTTAATTTAATTTTTIPRTTSASNTTLSREEAALYEPGMPEMFDYYEISSRYYTEYDYYGYSNYELQKGINDIYARNGLIFETPQIQRYYEQQAWYYPETDNKAAVKSNMNDYERANIETMGEYSRN